jgi:hypothetical protein
MSGKGADSPPVPNKTSGVEVDIPYSPNKRRLTAQLRLTKKQFMLAAGFYFMVLRVFFVFDIFWG